MQSRPQHNKYSGLLAVFGLIVLAIGFIVLVIFEEIRPVAWGILGAGLVILAAAFILDLRRLSGSFTARKGRLRIGNTVIASIFIGIILIVNAISFSNYQHFDTTSMGQFTLSDQTKEMLSAIKDPVEVLSFYESGDPIGSYADNLLVEYERYTEKLKHKTVDPVVHPDQARQFGLTQFPAVVFESRSRQRIVTPQEIVLLGEEGNYSFEVEHPFTSALLEVTGKSQKKVYFLTGHGEQDTARDYSVAREGLLNDLYQVGTLNLLSNPSIPADCAVLIIAGPKTALESKEVKTIDAYLKGGGQVFILADPNFTVELNQILSPWGISLANGAIIDPTSNVAPRKDTPLVPQSKNAFNLPRTYFPGAIALIPQQQVADNLGGRTLLVTSDAAWLEKDYNASSESTFDENKDIKGPLIMGILIAASPVQGSTQTKSTRLVIIGDSDFANNQNIVNGNNGDLFFNAVSWLAEETQLITIRRNVLPFRQLVIDPSQTNFLRYSSIALLPAVVIVIGGVIWWRRR
jgi:ABC-type uncharacterized transport system involved in gliding motility auxiliary subunit